VSLYGLFMAILLAIAPNDPVEIQLLGGSQIAGRVARVRGTGLDVTTAQGSTWVNLDLIESARLGGRELTPQELREEIQIRLQYELERLPEVGTAPNPVLAGTASFLLPGGGQAMLGEWGDARALFFADLVLLGLGSYLWFVQEDRPAAVPLFALDLIFRSHSASQAYRISRRRRALLKESSSIFPGKSP
jgi:hypothetical protein